MTNFEAITKDEQSLCKFLTDYDETGIYPWEAALEIKFCANCHAEDCKCCLSLSKVVKWWFGLEAEPNKE